MRHFLLSEKMPEFLSFEEEQRLYNDYLSEADNQFANLKLAPPVGMPCLLGQQHVLKRPVATHYGTLSASQSLVPQPSELVMTLGLQ